MKKLDKFLKECNLVFTNTINKFDFARCDFDVLKVEINYDDCMSLFELVASFNNLYQMFRKEYVELEKLDLGKKVELLEFLKFQISGNSYRNLVFYIDQPTITNHQDTILFLREIDGNIMPFVTNDLNPFDKYYYRDDVQLDKEISKKYLDLFDKYSLLLKVYKYLCNNGIYGDGTFSIFTSIDNHQSNLLEGLNTFEISFGSNYFDTEFFTSIVINLEEELTINYQKSFSIIDGEKIALDNENFDNMINEVFVNKKYIKIHN